MRTCDVCKMTSVDARLFDNVLVGILKQTTLSNQSVSLILDKLKIKQSVVSVKPTYGDICNACARAVEAEIVKIVDDGLKAIAKSIEAVADQTKSKMDSQSSNAAWFNAMTEDRYSIRKA